ncbi:polysaccharide deacetylase family protein [Bacillus sp. FJAT-52991]|uniref:Polysaccharide deacetylase family protein n=1 Tax=Bacillus kandeliae TaxID=3129297 RepID=A0ABZ2NBZ8_9BACI
MKKKVIVSIFSGTTIILLLLFSNVLANNNRLIENQEIESETISEKPSIEPTHREEHQTNPTTHSNQQEEQHINSNKNSLLPKIPVFMYHHFDKNIQNGVIADPAIFEEQMRLLKENGYTTLTTQDVIDIKNGKLSMPQKPIMITIDDGYESNYTYVYPILKKFNMKATIFIITDYIENPQNHPSEYPKMNWEQIQEMSDSGLVLFQAHTDILHTKYSSLLKPMVVNGEVETYEQYEQRVFNDVVKCKNILESRLGKPVTAFSYPNGLYSSSSEEIIKKAGYEMTVVTEPGLLDLQKDDSLYLVKRINIHGKASADSILTKIAEMEAKERYKVID